MDNDLIDRQLIDLLRIPAEQRTVATIGDCMSRIGAAAQIETISQCQLQQEQLKLFAIVEFMAAELGMRNYDVSLTLQENKSRSVRALCTYLSDGPEGAARLIGFGRTAEEVLKDLHSIAENKDAA